MTLPVFGNAATGAASGSITSITSDSIDASAGSNQCLAVGLAMSADSSNPVTCDSVVWDVPSPQGMTIISHHEHSDYTSGEFWRLVGITQATDTVTADFDILGEAGSIVVLEIEGVNQTTPIGNDGVDDDGTDVGGTVVSITLTSVASDDLLIDVFATDQTGTPQTPVAGANQTERAGITSGGSYPQGSYMSTQSGADGAVMSYTKDESTHDYQAGANYMAAVFQPIAAGTTPHGPFGLAFHGPFGGPI